VIYRNLYIYCKVMQVVHYPYQLSLIDFEGVSLHKYSHSSTLNLRFRIAVSRDWEVRVVKLEATPKRGKLLNKKSWYNYKFIHLN